MNSSFSEMIMRQHSGSLIPVEQSRRSAMRNLLGAASYCVLVTCLASPKSTMQKADEDLSRLTKLAGRGRGRASTKTRLTGK